jgi:uncharacterized protein YndB with AHSA1/START domain
MITKHKASFVKNTGTKTITVVKEIDATVEQVWKAWTTADQLDKWWGPKPWNAVTKKMNFTDGGSWVYKMVGPNGEEQWDKVNFTDIHAPNSFSATDLFTDENGNKKTDMPSMRWKNSFTSLGNTTKIESVLSFDSKEDMDKILKSGFEEGFSKGLEQLDDLLA